MRWSRGLLPLALVLVPRVHADVKVHQAQGRVDVAATAAPLADVLDHLARQIGMKVVYEGAAPRQLVTLSLADRSPAEAVAAILEGQGLNYALVLDETATRVDQLLVTGPAPVGGVAPARGRPFSPPPMRTPPILRPPPLQDDEDEAEPADEPADKAASDTPNPAGDKGQPPSVNPANPAAAGTPTLPAFPLTPATTYSSSPFNPKPIPIFPTAPQPQAPQPQPTPASGEKAP